MTDKVVAVDLDAPSKLSLLANPEELSHEDLSTFTASTTVVPLEKYIVMKAAADASAAGVQKFQQLLLTSLKRANIQQDLIVRLKEDLKMLDQLNEDLERQGNQVGKR